MSRVHCLDCRTPVVVDPQGRCPEGHDVGERGARIDQAMGSSLPYPDEPEPWVGTVVLDPPERLQPTGTNEHAPRRPEPAWRPDHRGATAEHEELLVEFQALSDLSELSDLHGLGVPVTPAVPTSPPAPRAPVSPPTAAAGSTAPPTPEDLQDVLAELSALERLAETPAPVRPTSGRSLGATTPAADGTTDPARAATRHDVTSPLFDTALDDFELDDLTPVSVDARRPVPPPDPTGATAHAGAPPAPHGKPEHPTVDRHGQEEPPSPEDRTTPLAPGLDLASFTARGSAGRGGRAGKRRLFGR